MKFHYKDKVRVIDGSFYDNAEAIITSFKKLDKFDAEKVGCEYSYEIAIPGVTIDWIKLWALEIQLERIEDVQSDKGTRRETE